MGNVQSSSCVRLFPSNKLRYHRISDSCDLQTQPLLQNQYQFMEVEHAAQVYWEKSLALENEIGALKSNFSRLETKLQTKGTEGNKQEAITSLEQKVDKLKKNLDGVIVGREAEKRMNSAEMSKRGQAIINIEEKNINLEKKIAELEAKVNEMTSSMVHMFAFISEFKDKTSTPEVHVENEAMSDKYCNPEEAPELKQARLPDITVKISEEQIIQICFLILIFLVGFLVGRSV